MRLIELQIDNHASFHFGDASGHLKRSFSSDQLFSAIVNNISKLYGPEKINTFIFGINENNIRISSLFYGVKILSKRDKSKQKTSYFLPRPKIEFSTNRNVYSAYKNLKKIEYVSIPLYLKLSEQFDMQEEACHVEFGELITIGKDFALLREELEGLDINLEEISSWSFLQVNVRPGVEVGRMIETSENFFMNEELTLSYGETANYQLQPFYYFFINGEMPTYVSAAIRLLKDEGIGGRRTAGKGFLKEIQIIEHPPALQKKGQYYMNLSTYFPANDEVQHLFQYELEKRNGFIYSFGGKTFRKKSVMIVNEGSLFHQKVQGLLEDIGHSSIEHPVYLYGKPMFIGFGGEGK